MAKQPKIRQPAAAASNTIDANAEQLLGQMMFAIGSGADGVHISRQAIAKMRQRYQPSTYAFVKKLNWETTWNSYGIFTLRYFEVIGRLSAQYATNDGSHTIDAPQLEQARVVVEARYRSDKGKPRVVPGGPGPRGDICPDPLDPPPPPPDGPEPG
jgi:hypothetical protein